MRPPRHGDGGAISPAARRRIAAGAVGIAVIGIVAAALALLRVDRGDGAPSPSAPGPTSDAGVTSPAEGMNAEDGASASAVPGATALRRAESALPGASTGAAAADDGSGALWTITGRVVDEEGAPVEGATVSLPRSRAERDASPEAEAALAHADADGRFTFRASGVPAHDSLGVWIQAPGFAGNRGMVDPPAGERWLGDVALVRASTIRGRVVDADGRPLVGVAVRSDDVDAVSGSDGTFVLESVRPGRHWLQPASAGFVQIAQAPAEVTVRSGETAGVTLVLAEGTTIRGRVRDPQGRPVSGATVFVRLIAHASGNVFRSSECAGDGTFALDVPAGSRFSIGARSPRCVPPEQRVLDATADPIELVLEPRPCVELRVTDAATGAPLEPRAIHIRTIPSDGSVDGTDVGRLLWLSAQNELPPTDFERADELGGVRIGPGRFAVPYQPVEAHEPGGKAGGGPLRVVLVVEHADRYTYVSPPIGVDGVSDAGPVIAALEKVPRIVGRVLDPAGRPQPFAQVALWWPLPRDERVQVRLAGVSLNASRSIQQHGRADAEGRFALAVTGRESGWDPRHPTRAESLKVGTVTVGVRAKALDFAPADSAPVAFDLRRGGDVMLDVTVAPGGFIESMVSGADGEPAAGEVLVAVDAAGFARAGRADGGGRVRLGPLPPGTYCVRLGSSSDDAVTESASGRFRSKTLPPLDLSSFTVPVEAGRTTRHDVDLRGPPPFAIVGRVAFDGAPPAKRDAFEVRVRPSGGGKPRGTDPATATNSSGSIDVDGTGVFRLLAVSPGTYDVELSATALDEVVAATSVTITAEHGAYVEFSAACRTIAGQVRDVTLGRPWNGTVTLCRLPSPDVPAALRASRHTFPTDDQGWFRIEGLLPGEYAIAPFDLRGGPLPIDGPPAVVDVRTADALDVELRAVSKTSAYCRTPRRFAEQARYGEVQIRFHVAGLPAEAITLPPLGDDPDRAQSLLFEVIPPMILEVEIIAVPAKGVTGASELSVRRAVSILPGGSNDFTDVVEEALASLGVLPEW